MKNDSYISKLLEKASMWLTAHRSVVRMVTCLLIGVVFGNFWANHISGGKLSISGGSRLDNLLAIIEAQYVDKVDMDSLVEKSIPLILSELDPHSAYISAKDVQQAQDDLKGSFSGVGIQFVVRKDTVRVQNVIKDGPAEKAGLVAGDKIVSIDDKPFTGKVVTNEEAMHRLKGPRDTKVKIGVLRYGQKQPRVFTVTRGEIVTHSVMASYMLNDSTGYLKIKNFGETTYPEMLLGINQLQENKGFSNLVIDLRDNTGGFLQAAVQMVNEFLPKNKLIVYTEGRKSPRQDYRSDGRGQYTDIPLVVLINEGSASASEIFAGAIQDNDRGTIIGRRSFGKGLVQQQMGFADGSLIRLTIARYYTPSGRCIQKPYTPGDELDYEADLLSRYEHGEFFSGDSIRHNGPAYKTSIGRTVYGGGGITPDIFVGEDTLRYTSYYRKAASSGLILQYSYEYTDQQRQKLKAYPELGKLKSFIATQGIVQKFTTWASANGLPLNAAEASRSNTLLYRYLSSRIIYNMLDEQSWIQYLNEDDPVITETLKVFREKKSRPTLKK